MFSLLDIDLLPKFKLFRWFWNCSTQACWLNMSQLLQYN